MHYITLKQLIGKSTLLLWALVGCAITTQAQDPQFSQYYAAKLYHNPAFAGTDQQHRLCVQYRNQWPGLRANYTTSMAAYDTPLGKTNHSIGAYAITDQAGLSQMRSTGFHGVYAYSLRINHNLVARAGLSLGYVIRNIDYLKLTFSDQFGPDGTYLGGTAENLQGFNIGFADIGAGGMLYSPKYWIGMSVAHLNMPRQDWHLQAERLPMRWVAMGGYNIGYGTREFISPSQGYRQTGYITPTFIYKHQGRYDQLDLGLYASYKMLVAGVWYRGLPILSVADGVYNHDALVFMAGVRKGMLSIGYSYDYSLSDIRFAGGSHEISVCIGFTKPLPYNGLPCPDI